MAPIRRKGRPKSVYKRGKKLVKKLKKLGFTQSELEEKVGASIYDMIWTIVPESSGSYRKWHFWKIRWKEILVAKIEDLLHTPFGTGFLDLYKKVYNVCPEVKDGKGYFRHKGIREEPGIETCDNKICHCQNTNAYVSENNRIVKKFNLRTPTEDEATSLIEHGVKYFEYSSSGDLTIA